jgi:hypothetical protein
MNEETAEESVSGSDEAAGRRWSIAGVIGCSVLALGFRIPSLSWGLPFLFHPDEPTNFSVVQRMLKQHDLNPHFFRYPSLFFYANALVQAAHSAAGHALGLLHRSGELPELDVPIEGSGFTTIPSAFIAGRALSTLCAVVIVWLAYRIGCALSNRNAGLLAALMVAVSPSVLRDSRWIAPDGMVTLAATATVLASLSVLRKGRARDYVLASVLAGLTASLKYNGGLVGITVCAAALLRDGRRAFRNPWFYAAPLIAAASFVLTSPFVVLDFRSFWQDFASERKHYATGHEGAEGNTLAFYCGYLWEWEGPGALLAVGGLVLGVLRRHAGIAVLGVFCAVYFCFINSFVTRNGQTLVPMVPTLLTIAAWFSSECLALVAARLRARHVPRAAIAAVWVVSVVALASYPLAGSVERTRPLLLKDNRELAGNWINEHVPAHSHIAIERYACYLDRKRYGLKTTRNLISLEPAWLREHTDYMVFAGDSFNRFLVDPERYRRQAARYRQLFRDFEFVKAFDDVRHGNEVRIYRARPDVPLLAGNRGG